MPLTNVGLGEKGVMLCISPNTNDNEKWQATVRHVAIEGHSFLIKSMNLDMLFKRELCPDSLTQPVPASRIESPTGHCSRSEVLRLELLRLDVKE